MWSHGDLEKLLAGVRMRFEDVGVRIYAVTFGFDHSADEAADPEDPTPWFVLVEGQANIRFWGSTLSICFARITDMLELVKKMGAEKFLEEISQEEAAQALLDGLDAEDDCEAEADDDE